MGYSLIIGEGKPVTYPAGEYYDDEEYSTVEVETVHLDNAPAFGEPTDHTNERWPSYSAWYNFAEHAGIKDLLLDEKGWPIGGHPGYFEITKEFRDAINERYDQYIKEHPNAQATYKSGNPDDRALCRFEWLKFWVNWAYENCENPVFKNT